MKKKPAIFAEYEKLKKKPPENAFTRMDFQKVADLSYCTASRVLEDKVKTGQLKSEVFKTCGHPTRYYWEAE